MLAFRHFSNALSKETQCSHVYVLIHTTCHLIYIIPGGTGEYTTGWTASGASTSDKTVFILPFLSLSSWTCFQIGVCVYSTFSFSSHCTFARSLALLSSISGDVKRLATRISQCNYQLSQTKVDKLGMVGVNGKKFPDIRAHLEKNIAGVYKNLDISWVIFHYSLSDLVLYPFLQLWRIPKRRTSQPRSLYVSSFHFCIYIVSLILSSNHPLA